MKSTKYFLVFSVVLCSGLATSYLAWCHGGASNSFPEAKQRARIAISQQLPQLNGGPLTVALVEVNYGPGESSSPHSHPCPVIAYVAQGAIRTQVKGQPETTYKAGESFYELPNGVHQVSANTSVTKPAKLLAFFVCDHEGPLSIPQNSGEGATK
jgi:quercetin dioxygenase-like cupin family protein